MRYLGIDYGTKRVGIAISDEGGEFAFPKAVVETTKALEQITSLCTSEHIEAIIIGESVASNGNSNELVQIVNTFKEKLATATNLPIFFQREDFSSVEAHRYQTAAGNRDDSAAAIILQRFLDRQKAGK